MTCFSGGAMEIYIEPHLPEPRLLVFGGSPVARALAELGAAMKFRVTVVDLSGRPSVLAAAQGVVTSLDDLPSLSPDSTYAVVATHGTFDDAALERLLELRPAYLGLVASRRRFDAVRRGLVEAGAMPDAIDRIRAPAGLEIGARQPEEVALAILAEIVELRRRPAPSAAATAVDEGAGARTTSIAAAASVSPPRLTEARVVSASDRSAAATPDGAKGCCHCEPHGD
jgi:xanthine dehydrogenase accessory factor